MYFKVKFNKIRVDFSEKTFLEKVIFGKIHIELQDNFSIRFILNIQLGLIERKKKL